MQKKPKMLNNLMQKKPKMLNNHQLNLRLVKPKLLKPKQVDQQQKLLLKELMQLKIHLQRPLQKLLPKELMQLIHLQMVVLNFKLK